MLRTLLNHIAQQNGVHDIRKFSRWATWKESVEQHFFLSKIRDFFQATLIKSSGLPKIKSLTCQPVYFEDIIITYIDSTQDRVRSSQLMKADNFSVCMCMCFAGKSSDEIQTDIHTGRAVIHWSWGGEWVSACWHMGGSIATCNICTFGCQTVLIYSKNSRWRRWWKWTCDHNLHFSCRWRCMIMFYAEDIGLERTRAPLLQNKRHSQIGSLRICYS